jgi:hypothetical protein
LTFKILNDKTQNSIEAQIPNFKNIHLDFDIWYFLLYK